MRFNPKRRHSPAYYFSVLRIVVPALVAGHSQPVIRQLLTASGIKSPTNGEWTEASLAGILVRLRERRGHFYLALLEMFLAGTVTRADVTALMRSH